MVKTITRFRSKRKRLLLLLVLSLLLPMTFVFVQTPANAATTVSVLAGNGMSGHSGDGGAATSAKLWGPKDLSTDSAGNVYIADMNNNVIRKVDTSGIISTVRGTPGVAKTLANGGLNRPGGVLALDAGGTYVSDTLNHAIWGTGNTPLAGNSCGQGGFSGDGGASYTGCSPAVSNPAKLNQPLGIGWLDKSTQSAGILIADQYNCRIRSASSLLSTVAGNGTCTFGGYGTNAIGDGGPATSAPLNYPTDVVGRNGKIYITDTSNCRVRVVAGGIISTLAGTGTCNDTGDGGPATSAGVKAPNGIDVDAAGNVYFGTQNGAIRRVNTAGIISTVANVPNSITGLTRDFQGNIYVSIAWDKVYKISGFNSAATVNGISTGITPNNPLYTMNVNFNLSGVNCPATARVTISTKITRYKPLCSSGEIAPTSGSVGSVSVLSLNPETSYPVKITVDDANGTSLQASSTLTTPKAPVWVSMGDSFSSGHHQDQDEPCNLNGVMDQNSFAYAATEYAIYGDWRGTCLDNSGAGASSYTPNSDTYAWATRARDQLMTQLNVPNQWRMVSHIVAQSGAQAQNFVLTGPTSETCNGCGAKDTMVSDLQSRLGSWNIVSINGGANDANFGGRLSDFYADSPQGQGKPWDVTYRSSCPDLDGVYNDVQSTSTAVLSSLSTVVNSAVATDPNVRRIAFTYPYVLNADKTCQGDSTVAPYAGAKSVIDELDSTILALSDTGTMVVDLRTANGFATNPENDIQLTRYFGFPHPNSAGQDAIASAIVQRLLS